MSIFLISLATFCSTMLGGVFALRFRDKLHLILGFSAGAVIGVAFLDLLPEAINLASPIFSIPVITSMTAFGFIIYMILDRSIFFHSHKQGGMEGSNSRGKLGAGSLAVHSFLDGVAIGLAFKVSLAVGVVVAATFGTLGK